MKGRQGVVGGRGTDGPLLGWRGKVQGVEEEEFEVALLGLLLVGLVRLRALLRTGGGSPWPSPCILPLLPLLLGGLDGGCLG